MVAITPKVVGGGGIFWIPGPYNLSPTHAYAVTGVVYEKESKKWRVEIVNPWGLPAEPGSGGTTDATRMDLDDFIFYFGSVTIEK
ncbi:MAG: hypothetical protein K2V38_17340 [Gemmataceae bacterium]|nr:hypothetical protein [Gemmataceae bacterium]